MPSPVGRPGGVFSVQAAFGDLLKMGVFREIDLDDLLGMLEDVLPIHRCYTQLNREYSP